MTQEEKAKRYDKALERARKLQENSNGMILKKWLWNIFPELKESEDEKIKKALISILKSDFEEDTKIFGISGVGEIIAWLEKQGKLPIPKLRDINEVVEPKFHEGDWVVTDKNNVVQIKEIEDNRYVLENTMKFSVCYVDKCWRKWNIRDAKDGDVLTYKNENTEWILIYKNIIPECCDVPHDVLKYHALFTGTVFYNSGCAGMISENYALCFTPAIKEQRELLFQKINDAGCTFDFEKKELKKLGQPEVTKTSDQEEIAEIPFGAKDSELQEATYYIPKGFHAEIDDDKVVIKRGEKHTVWSEENGRRIQRISDFIWKNRKGDTDDIYQQEQDVKWLKSLKDRVGCAISFTTTKEWSEEDEHRVKDTIYFLDTAKKHYASTVELDACINWLKTIKQRIKG